MTNTTTNVSNPVTNKIYLSFDTKVIWVMKEHLENLKYFQTIFKNPDTYGLTQLAIHGQGMALFSLSNPINLDFNCTDIKNIIEYVRNGDNYELNEKDKYVWNSLTESPIIDSNDEFIKIHIGEKQFVTTVRTLTKLNYFNAVINNFKMEAPVFLDRNGSIFKHILRHLRNPLYELPERYAYELDFFGGFTDSQISFARPKLDLLDMITPQINYSDSDHNESVGIYLCGNPQITFHKMKYNRYTYSETNDMIIDGVPNEKTIMYIIPKNNVDLITGDIYLILPSDIISVVQKIEMKCGNLVIDKTSKKLIEFLSENLPLDTFNAKSRIENSDQIVELYFYNKNNNGMAFPNCTVEENVTIEVTLTESRSDSKSKLCIEYVKLFEPELRRFISVGHEYLITLWKEYEFDFETSTPSMIMNMKGAFDMIYIEILSEEHIPETLIDASLYINSELRKYINPFISNKNLRKIHGKKINNVYAMIFCKHSNYASTDVDIARRGHQYYPSGHIAISNGCNINFNLNCTKGRINIYARKYNVLRITRRNAGVDPQIALAYDF